ncbi:hypothetical protein VTO42DRAFT_7631 [Malbranchea cinnamomea]
MPIGFYLPRDSAPGELPWGFKGIRHAFLDYHGHHRPEWRIRIKDQFMRPAYQPELEAVCADALLYKTSEQTDEETFVKVYDIKPKVAWDYADGELEKHPEDAMQPDVKEAFDVYLGMVTDLSPEQYWEQRKSNDTELSHKYFSLKSLVHHHYFEEKEDDFDFESEPEDE